MKISYLLILGLPNNEKLYCYGKESPQIETLKNASGWNNMQQKGIVMVLETEPSSSGQYHIMSDEKYRYILYADKSYRCSSAACLLKESQSMILSGTMNESSLRTLVQKYENDKITDINNQLNEIKVVMNENIDLALKRGENLELIQDKAETLAENANKFNKGATKLKTHMKCRNMKITILLTVVAMLIIGIIVAVIISIT